MNLEQFARSLMDTAVVIFEARGEVHPVFFSVDRNDEMAVLPPPPGSKDQSVALARMMFEAVGAVRCAYVGEAWTMEIHSSEEETRVRREGVAAQAGRREVIMVQAEDETEGQISARCEIIRDGRKARLGPIEVERFSRSEGRMVGLLPARGKAQ